MAHKDKDRPITTWRRPIGENEKKCVAHEDKGRPITTWRRPIGENVRGSVWHIKTKDRPITTWRRPIGENVPQKSEAHKDTYRPAPCST